jgi:tetratricopeptide (TPR) repeat protein
MHFACQHCPFRSIHGVALAAAFLAALLGADSSKNACADEPKAAAADVAAAEAAPAERAAQVSALIEQLGAEGFAEREKAQAELAQMGLEVFDTLHAAQNHRDPEVALRARYLVRSMSVRWFQETDPPEVVRILKGYGDQSESERRNRMDRLAGLENQQGVAALCRLSRFETDDTLSKSAALKLLEQTPPTDAAAKAELQKTLSGIVGSSNRPAATWVRLYVQTLADPASSLAGWDAATKAEKDTLSKNPNQTSREIVRDLYRYQVELLKRLDRQDEAIAVIRRTFDLLDGTVEQITEVVDWLMQREAHAVVVELNDRFAAAFSENALLLYRLAEANQKLGDAEKARQIVDQALALGPENLDQHLRAGYVLSEERGLHDWAEREYREVIKNAGAGTFHEFRSRFFLSEMLHDQGKELLAAQALQPVCDLMEKDETAKDTCLKAQRDPPGVVSRMYYFYACHDHESGDFKTEREHLQTAFDSDPQDADVLIAMHRLPQADEAWQKLTRDKIAETAADFRAEIDGARQGVEGAPNEQIQSIARERLGINCNQYAWLVGNTFGDFDEAVKMSQLSLEMRPDYYGYLDTLGRCYFAKGDFENAIKYQSQALQRNPHSGQIRRQLEFFQKEQAAQASKQPAAKQQP